MKSPFLACLYSLLAPGLGQIYLKEQGKGWALLCMTLGIWASLFFSHSLIARILLGALYLFILVPAVTDAYQCAAGRPQTFTGDSLPYVVFMLLMIGPFAIPLLWQSPRFSKTAKIAWTVAVVIVALAAIAATTFMASFFDGLMKQNPAILS